MEAVLTVGVHSFFSNSNNNQDRYRGYRYM